MSSLYILLTGVAAFIIWKVYSFCLNDRLIDTTSVSVEDAVRDLVSNPIAVVIPTLREAAVLPDTIALLFSNARVAGRTTQHSKSEEPTVIVVDAGGHEETRTSLAPLMTAHPTLHLVRYPGKPSRGGQLNFGAAHAATIAPQASTLLFLHADTHLPPGWNVSISKALLSSPNAQTLGAFTLSLPPPLSSALRLMLWGANRRARWGGLPYGDQAYFMTKRTFDAVGGFPSVPIMEDVELLRRVAKEGRVVILEDAVKTNPRRWVQKGVFWNTLLNQLLITAWMCGASHETIYRWYYGRQTSSK